jgi:hypothetical protein
LHDIENLISLVINAIKYNIARTVIISIGDKVRIIGYPSIKIKKPNQKRVRLLIVKGASMLFDECIIFVFGNQSIQFGIYDAIEVFCKHFMDVFVRIWGLCAAPIYLR